MIEKLASCLNAMWRGLPGNTRKKTPREELIEVMNRYDMIDNHDERFFSGIYWHWIVRTLERSAQGRCLKILDAGCGQGRFAVPLLERGHDVTGIEISPDLARSASEHAARHGLQLKVITGDIRDVVPALPAGSFDAIVCIEVMYLIEHYDRLIADLTRLLKKGGLLFVAFRPKLYYIRYFIRQNYFAYPLQLTDRNCTVFQDGRLNCQWPEDMESLLKNHGYTQIEVHGIGVASGIEGDPQACFAIPSKLAPADQEKLFAIELVLSEECPGSGRYVLVSGTRE